MAGKDEKPGKLKPAMQIEDVPDNISMNSVGSRRPTMPKGSSGGQSASPPKGEKE